MDNIKTIFKEDNLSYRIPNIITTKNGTLVACCDQRFYTARDNPNRIEKVVKRSLDNGKTWEDIIVVIPEIGENKDNASASIDPALLYDKENNVIFMLYSFTPVGVSILSCKPSLGYVGENLIVYDKSKKMHYVNVKNGKIYTKNHILTEFSVDEAGYIYKNNDNNRLGNIKLYNDYFEMEKTGFICICSSNDEGKTWSKPICLNTQVKKKSWGFIGAGPGIGLTLENGKHKGRYVFPIYIGKLKFPPALSCLALYSDDLGKTWKLGDFIKKMTPFFSPSWLMTNLWTTESQYVELADGKLLAFVRNHNSKRLIANAYSDNGGETWYGYKYNEYLSHPICQISAIRAVIDGVSYIITCNAEDKHKRRLGVVKISTDNGLTFPFRKVITEGEFVYSSMSVTKDNKIIILFEPETLHTKIDYVIYDIKELLVKE